MGEKKYTVVVSEKAAAMLVRHVKFLARVSPEAAEAMRQEIISAARSLEYMPEAFPWLSQEGIPANRYRKRPAAKRYLLIYQIKEDVVYIDAILDGRQEHRRLP